MMKLTLPAIAICFALPAFAECPPAPDHSEAFANLVERINAAESDAEAQPLSNQMWELWLDAPNEQSKEILDSGMRKRSGYDMLGSIADFDRLVAYCPDYAEGYNQRAFTYFLQRDFDNALKDLARAIELSPQHTGALSGRALTYLELGDKSAARNDLLKALETNPWLGERHLLAKGGPLAVPGEDI